MRLGSAIVLAAIAAFTSAATAATTDPTIDVVGQWGSHANCVEGMIGFDRNDGGLYKVVYDNGVSYRTRLEVSMEGNVLHLIDEEKKFSYRVIGNDQIVFIGFTNLSNGLTARTRPQAWHRCQPA